MRLARLAVLTLLLGGCAQDQPGQQMAYVPPSYPSGSSLQSYPASAVADGLAQPAARTDATAARNSGPEPFRSEIAITLPGRGAEGVRDISAFHEADEEGDWTYQFLEFRDAVGDRESFLRITNVYTAPILSSEGWRFWEVASDPKRGEVGIVPVRRAVDCDEAQFRAATRAFVGEIDQVPPMHSALKREGRPLYEYARAGVTLERAPRRVAIHAIETLAFAGSRATIRVRCSKGTYIRTLAADIGERLGCGAPLSGLRRERVGTLSVADAITLEALEALEPAARRARLAPADALLSDLPRVDLDVPSETRFLHGQKLRAPAAAGTTGRVRVYGAGRLLGVAALRDGALVPQRLVATGDSATKHIEPEEHHEPRHP